MDGYRKSNKLYSDSPFIKRATEDSKARVVKPSEIKETSPEGSEKEEKNG